MTIIKVEYDTEDPLCSIVNNFRLQAKKEVFDDKLITDLRESIKGFKEGSREYAKRKFALLIIVDLQKRHLSTSQSSDKPCPECNRTGNRKSEYVDERHINNKCPTCKGKGNISF